MALDIEADFETPALCIDLEALQYNIDCVSSWCRRFRKQWRPHAKCHKSPLIAERLLAAGAIGATCAKLGEAEVLAGAGIRDLLIANMLVGERKWERLAQLCLRADPIVCLDSPAQAEGLNRVLRRYGHRVRVLIEVDIGMQRVGVSSPESAWRLAQQILRLPQLELTGIMGYEGHLLVLDDVEGKRRRIWAALDILQETRDLWQRHGVACSIVSCGGTGSLPFCLEHPVATEVQAGGAIFMDEFYRHRCRTLPLRQALWVKATVVSRPAPSRAVMDAGRKTLSMDLAMPRVVRPGGCQVTQLSAEHGILALAPDAERIDLGTPVLVIPGYSDFTTVLHDQYVVIERGRVVDFWSIAARGKLQ